MCLLTFYPPYVLPDIEALNNGADINCDGHGFGIVTGKRITVRHGMDGEHMVAEFTRIREKYPEGPALFHSRLGTHGKITKGNCHPFRVGGDPRTILAHNGILPAEMRPRTGDKRSDTRILAEDVLPLEPWGPLGSRRGRDRLGQWIGTGNKLVILTVDPRYDERAYIINESSGIWDEGVWYSNDDYRALPDSSGWEWPSTTIDDWPCPTCHMTGAFDPADGYCMVCGTCADCGEPDGFCNCYAPGKLGADPLDRFAGA